MIGTSSGSVATKVNTVAVPFVFNATEPGEPVVIVGLLFTSAMLYQPVPVQRYNLFVAETNAVVPAATPVKGKSLAFVYDAVDGVELSLLAAL